MNNLALSYSDLGRHADALDMQEKVLEFRLRELPKDHPDIGDSVSSQLGQGSLCRYRDFRCFHEQPCDYVRRIAEI